MADKILQIIFKIATYYQKAIFATVVHLPWGGCTMIQQIHDIEYNPVNFEFLTALEFQRA